MTSDEKIKLCRIVGVMLLTDGLLQESEVEFLRDLMDRLGLSTAEREAVMDRIDGDTEVLEDAAALRAHGIELLEALREASRVDGLIAPEEADLVQMVARALDYEL